jgi:hypothetical protein|tara:strand:+ start:166 stop:711 length:546 start_codon:yes stop_codon:yes gene_type:complete
MDNIFKKIEEGPKGTAFKGMCEIAHAFMKAEIANAEDEVKKYLDKAPNFNDEGKFVGVEEVIKNGFNWYMIEFLYGRGGIHYLIKNNQFLDFGDDDLMVGANLRYRRLKDNGWNEKDAMKECMSDIKYANDVILKACDEDADGMGKKGYEIYNKGNHAIYYFITGKPNEEYSLKSIVKEFK